MIRTLPDTVYEDRDEFEKALSEAARTAGLEIAFCSAGSAQSKQYAPMLVAAGAVVIDKSRAFRMDPRVPLVVHAAKGARRHLGLPELHRESPRKT